MCRKNIMRWDAQLSEDDKYAKTLFEKHKNEFGLDVGSLDNRYKEAKRFTDTYFSGTSYSVEVEEYCVMCTETSLFVRR